MCREGLMLEKMMLERLMSGKPGYQKSSVGRDERLPAKA